MGRNSKAVSETVTVPKKLVFPDRISVRLDDDVRALLNASVERGVKWKDKSHAVNAGLRRAYQPFASAGTTIRVCPFEQLVFARKIIIKDR